MRNTGTVQIREARPDDLARLQDIEVAAGVAFRDVGLSDIADHEPPSIPTLAGYQEAGRAWVAVDGDDLPAAYLLVDVIDGCAHIEQVSVHPAYARRGVGRALIDYLSVWASAQGIGALTLTTFRDVPWNGPYYQRLGFRELASDEITPGLVDLVAAEAVHGLDPATRLCMRRDVG